MPRLHRQGKTSYPCQYPNGTALKAVPFFIIKKQCLVRVCFCRNLSSFSSTSIDKIGLEGNAPSSLSMGYCTIPILVLMWHLSEMLVRVRHVADGFTHITASDYAIANLRLWRCDLFEVKRHLMHATNITHPPFSKRTHLNNPTSRRAKRGRDVGNLTIRVAAAVLEENAPQSPHIRTNAVRPRCGDQTDTQYGNPVLGENAPQ